MKICVLQPDYTGSPVDYGNYDPQRNLTPWLPGHEVDHLFLKKSTTYLQLMKAAEQGYDIYINLCEGYPEWDIPGFDVIWALERLNLPFTGTTMRNFLHSKENMKIVAHACGVATPAWFVMRAMEDLNRMPVTLRYPLFVKPADSGDSLGIDERSLVRGKDELRRLCAELLGDFNKILIEEYVDGREFTVLLASDGTSHDGVLVLTPFEFVFDSTDRFKTYRMKVTEHHKTNNVPVTDPELSRQLKDMASRIFHGFEAESYVRIDMRANQAGEVFFLEINCECSVFYPEGSEGSADYILKHEPMGHAGFLRHIIDDGIKRHQRRQKCFESRIAPDGGLGCFALRDLVKGAIVAAGEGEPQRFVSHTDSRSTHTPPIVSQAVTRLRPASARDWTPFRKSPDGNLEWRGLDLVAQRPVASGEELLIRG
jgi:D-alanine-D-alanine ligase-like ATP-grasp enzyme